MTPDADRLSAQEVRRRAKQSVVIVGLRSVGLRLLPDQKFDDDYAARSKQYTLQVVEAVRPGSGRADGRDGQRWTAADGQLEPDERGPAGPGTS